MIASLMPIWLVDVIGSLLMIVFAFLCFGLSRGLKKKDPHNLIFTYLLWLSTALFIFALSRSAGHLIKQVLLLIGQREIWSAIQPFSGAINTLTFIVVAAVTLFFERSWIIYGTILEDRRALQKAHQELLYLNQNLEKSVQKRSDALARSEKQIAQADKLASIGQLSSGIAHEINNPLGIILGYTQLLLRAETEETQKYEDLKIIEKHVKSCQAIVADLLNFARSAPSKRDRIDVHQIIEEALTFIQHQSGTAAMQVETVFDRNTPLMLLDEKKIKQVLINLLMNALHASGGAGSIHIKTIFNPEEKRLAILVKDEGYGIEQRNIRRIFDPFFTTKPTGEGTGLGLAVSYGIVKRHGGEIAVTSKPGEGAVFTVYLPVSHEKRDSSG